MRSVGESGYRTRHTIWAPSYRTVPSRFPPIGLFDRVADPEDLDAVYAIEAMTNDRIRDESGVLALVPANERISGVGTTPIMAAFTHLNPDGTRFSDGAFGVYYCAKSAETSLAEVRHHKEEFLRQTRQGPIRLELRMYLSDLDARLVDVRKDAAPHDPDDYAPGQKLGSACRAEARDGILYRSVRDAGGVCAAVFRPRVLSPVRQSKHYAFHFDGERIFAIDESSSVWVAPKTA